MNVGDVMGEQNERNWLRNLSFILFRNSPSQHIDTVWNHVNDVPLAAPSAAVAVFLHRHDWNVRIVKPMVRRRSWVQIVRRLIRPPEIAELPVKFQMRGVTKSLRIIHALFDPA